MITRLPKDEFPGYSVTEYARFDVALPENPGKQSAKQAIAIGPVLDNGVTTDNWFEVYLNDLTKHGLIVGTTGSGKTNTCMYLLDQLWKEHHIPFLVIEPAKSEYRNLSGAPGFEELQIFTLGDDAEKAFLIGLLLIRLYEYYDAQTRSGNIPTVSQLGHVTLVEEAHRLLKNVPTEKTGEESANPKGKAVEAFCHMLAELRAYGEGILIAEQIPLKLAPDVIKNTNLKVMHRLVALDDREAVGEAMNLDERQKRYVTTLKSGRAAVYAEGADSPYLVQVPDYKGFSLKGGAKSDPEIKELMEPRFHQKFPNIFLPFDGCARCRTYARSFSDLTLAQSVLDDEQFERNFTRFFLTIIEQPRFLMQVYSDVLGEIRRVVKAKSPEEEKKFAYCAMLLAVERSLDARGRLYDWKYGDQAKLERLMHEIVTRVVLSFQATDVRAIAHNETEEQLKTKYEQQRKRHIEAYEHAMGRKVLEYIYSPYPSPKEI